MDDDDDWCFTATFEHMKLVKIYRVGHGSSRSILAQFYNPQDRDLVWKVKPRAHYAYIKSDTTLWEHGPRFFITQDYPQEIQTRRRILIPVLNKAKHLEEYRDNSFIGNDKFHINWHVKTVDTTDELPTELNPQNIATLTNGHITAFWGCNSPLWNHHLSNFVVDWDSYNNVKHKKEMQWFATYHMTEGLCAKFQENEELRKFHLGIKHTELLEASPYDLFWGVGIAITDSQIFKKEQNWKEKTILESCYVRYTKLSMHNR